MAGSLATARARLRKVTLEKNTTEMSMNITVGVADIEETFPLLFPTEMAPSLAEWTSS